MRLRAIWLVALLLLAVGAEAQEFIRYYPPGSVGNLLTPQGATLTIGYQTPLEFLTTGVGAAAFQMVSNSSTYDGTVDNVFVQGYNTGFGNGYNVAEHMLRLSMESNYDYGAGNLMEWNLDYLGPNATPSRRFMSFNVNRATHVSSWLFQGDPITFNKSSGGANLTLTDISNTSAVPFGVPNGTAALAGLYFTADPDTGLLLQTAGTLELLAGGGSYFTLSAVKALLETKLSFSDNSYLSDESANTLQVGLDAATATTQTVKGPDSTGATIAGASLTLKGGAGTSGIANGGALILSGGANSSTGEPGAVAIADGGTQPTCAAGIRGSIWYDAGGAGVADKLEVCAKQAAGDTYAWRAMATIP